MHQSEGSSGLGGEGRGRSGKLKEPAGCGLKCRLSPGSQALTPYSGQGISGRTQRLGTSESCTEEPSGH